MNDLKELQFAIGRLNAPNGELLKVEDNFTNVVISGTFNGKPLEVKLSIDRMHLMSHLEGYKPATRLDIKFNGNVMIGNGSIKAEDMLEVKRIINAATMQAESRLTKTTQADWNELMEAKA